MSKIKSWYLDAAVITLNTFLFLAVVNLLIYMTFLARDTISKLTTPAERNPIEKFYGEATILRAYPGWRPADVDALLTETWAGVYLKLKYEPFTEFREQPHRGRYVTVDPAGFRAGDHQGPWPPAASSLNIFVFGGSTTFGYGLPDRSTVPSSIQESLNSAPEARHVAVYNFGRGFYYSSQEAALFHRMLIAGTVPDIAVFIDGLNDFYYLTDEPHFTASIRNFMEGPPPSSWLWLHDIPTVRMLRSIRRHLLGEPAEQLAPRFGVEDEASLRRVAVRWLRTKRLIEETAREFHVSPIFVFQPVPSYKYDVKYHLFYSRIGDHTRSGHGYQLLEQIRQDNKFGANVLWLGDIQQGRHENLYVDAVHYTDAFAREIAAHISSFIRQRNLLNARKPGEFDRGMQPRWRHESDSSRSATDADSGLEAAAIFRHAKLTQ